MDAEQADGLRRWVRVGTIILFILLLVAAFLLAERVNGGLLFGRYSFKSSVLLGAVSYFLAWGVYLSLTRQPTRLAIARFLLVSVSLAFVLGALEFATLTRLVDYRNIFVPKAYGITNFDPFRDPTWRVDPELIHIRRGGATIEGTTQGNLAEGRPDAQDYPVHAVYDDNGFRNDRTASSADIIVIGDSFIEAGLVPTVRMLTSQLGALLGVDVVNLGQCAYGPQQESIVLRRFGLPLRPDVVVWCFFGGNDLSNISSYEYNIAHLPGALAAHDGFSQRSLTKNVLQLVTSLTNPFFIDREAEVIDLSGFVPVNGKPTKMYFIYPGQALTDADEENLEKAKVLLRQARDQVEQSGAKFLLAYIPTKFAVYESVCEFPAGSEMESWRSNDLPERIHAWCGDTGISFLDLTGPLKDAAIRGEMVYMQDDTHWSARGNEVTAEAIADYLRERKWLVDAGESSAVSVNK